MYFSMTNQVVIKDSYFKGNALVDIFLSKANATIVSTKSNGSTTKAIKQEPLANNTKGSIIKIIPKTVKSEVREIIR